MASHNFAGGSFTLLGEDVDGNLSDDDSDPVTMTCTGTFGGMTYAAKAVIAERITPYDVALDGPHLDAFHGVGRANQRHGGDARGSQDANADGRWGCHGSALYLTLGLPL